MASPRPKRTCCVQDYIDQRLAAGCDIAYLRQLFDYLIYVISRLEAPARRPETQQVHLVASQWHGPPHASPSLRGQTHLV